MTKSEQKKLSKEEKKTSIVDIKDSFPFNINNDNKKRISSQCIERCKKLSARVIEAMILDDEVKIQIQEK